MSNDKVKAHMALVRSSGIALAGGDLDRITTAFAAVEASAIALQAEQAGPSDAKDAALYRYLVVMETKAAPDTVAHYIRNPEHLDRVIEVMKQKP